jgi:hypothetical protein
VLVHANVCFARRSARPGTEGAGTGRLGAARCERGRGASRFTARRSLRRPDTSRARRCLPSTWSSDRLWHLCRLLRAAARSRRIARRLEGRQDRFRGGLVKGVRFPDRRCLPSPAAARTAPAPRCERVTPSSSIARCSRDEDRRAPTNRPRFAPRAAYARASVVLPRRARLPFTRSADGAGFRPAPSLVARFPEPEGVLTISANKTMHGHRPRARDPRPPRRADWPPANVRLKPPPRGGDLGDEPRAACFRRSWHARTGPTEQGDAPSFGDARSLLEPGRTPPCRASSRARGGPPLASGARTGLPGTRERAPAHR